MFNPFDRVYSTDQNLYFKNNWYQLWAHLQPDSLLLQLRAFFTEGGFRTFAKSLTKISHQNSSIDHKAIFRQLSASPPKNPQLKNGKIHLKFQHQLQKPSKYSPMPQLQLDQLKNEPVFDNWILLKIIEQKTDRLKEKILERDIFIQQAQENEEDKGEDTKEGEKGWRFQHENARYRFQAQLDLINREIKTELVVKAVTDRNGKLKDKCYKSAIKEKQWDQQYRNEFKNIETLYQHLKNTNNYQVLQSKGLIKIKNEPIPILDFSKVKNLQGAQTEKTLNKYHQASELKKKVRKASQQIKIDTSKLFAEKELHLAKEINELGEKLESKLNCFIRESEKQIVNHQNQEYKRYSGKFKNLEKDIRKQIKSSLKKQVQDIRSEAFKTIKDIVASYEARLSESSANMRKSHLIQPRNMSETKAFKVNKIANFDDHKEGEDPRIFIDEKSSQIQHFYVGKDGDLIYRGPWDWTQVFTTACIDFKGTYQLKFRVLKSVYNAIAIGVSSQSNRSQRSSLTKPQSISYWGDGQIWQQMKVTQQGNGFQIGQTLTMQITRSTGSISWTAGKTVASHKSKMLMDKNIKLWAYLEMYDNGDKVQLLTCKLV